MEDEILTLEEVSKYLKVHKATVYRMAKAGDIPALKVGRIWRFKRDKIETWLDGREVGQGRGVRPRQISKSPASR